MSILDRAKSFFRAEGAPRTVFGEGELGGWYELGNWADGYQQNLTVTGSDARHIPAAYASVMANARAISQCPAVHTRESSDGRREIVKTSAASRIFRNPNSYETWSQFVLNSVAQMLFDGESFALAIRNDRNEVVALHRMSSRTCSPYMTPEGDLFYSVGENPFVEDKIDYLVPARDILHLRSHTPRHPLMGESPIKAAAMGCWH